MARSGSTSTETIGERLRRLRLARGLSQRELARPGVSFAYISRIEAGSRQPSVKALRKLAVVLGVSAEYLETGSELDVKERRELRLADAELGLRLGALEDGEDALLAVAEEAAAAGDAGQAARARLALGLAAAERGEHARAVAELEQAFRLEAPSPFDRLDAYATLGRSYSSLGETGAAIRLYLGALEEAERVAPDDRVTTTRLRILLSYALSDAGELERAEQLLHEALAAGDVPDDPYMRVRIVWSLARLSEMEGRSARALRYARRAIALLETTEDTLQAARAHVLAAWIMNSSGDPAGAREQLAAAERLFGDTIPADDRALLLVESARAAASLGDGRAAITHAREALALVGEQYGAIRGTALWALAQGLAAEGETAAADRAYADAVEALTTHTRWREASDACRAWGALLRQAGQSRRAFAVLERASEIALRVAPSRRQTPTPPVPSRPESTRRRR